MPNEFFSRPLSTEARFALIEFAGAYIATMASQTANITAEVAKQKAIAVLSTDIDIMVFIMMASFLCSQAGAALIYPAVCGRMSHLDGAVAALKVLEEAIRRDKQRHTS